MSLSWDTVLSVKHHSQALAMGTDKPGTVQIVPPYLLLHLGLKSAPEGVWPSGDTPDTGALDGKPRRLFRAPTSVMGDVAGEGPKDLGWFWGCLAQNLDDNPIHFASPVPDRGLQIWRENNKIPGKLKQKLGDNNVEGGKGVIAGVRWERHKG